MTRDDRKQLPPGDADFPDMNESPRERAQRLPSGSFRRQVRDPIHPSRLISIVCPTEAETIAKCEVVRQWRRDLRMGLIAPEEIAQRLRRLTGEVTIEALLLKDVWRQYVESFDPARQRALDGAWSTHFSVFERRNVLDLGAEDWNAWEESRGKECARSYIKVLFAMIRSATMRQVRTGKIASFPWRDWKPSGKHGHDPRKREPLRSIEEIEALLRAARDHDQRLRGWGLYSDALVRVAALFFAALRQGEAAALGWDHVRTRPDGKMLFEIEFAARDGWRTDCPQWDRPRWPPKRASTRTLVVHELLAVLMYEHRSYLEGWGLYQRTGPVFPVPPKKGRVPGEAAAEWRNNEWIIKPSLVRDFARAAGLEIDVRNFDAHALRHSFVTLELAATNNPIATAQRSGHKDLRVFFQYAHTVGRGLPESPLQALRLQPPARAIPVPVAGELPPAASVADITSARALEIEEARAGAAEIATIVGPVEDAEDFGRKVSALEAAFHRWSAAGRPTRYPREVTERMNQAYSRAYNAAIRRRPARGETNEERKKRAQEAGFRAKRAVQGAWGKLLRRVGLGAAEPEPAEVVERDQEVGEAPLMAANGGGVVIPFRRKGE